MQVDVFHPGLARSFCFPCSQWLRKTREAGLEGCARKLLAGAADAATGLVTYKWAVLCRKLT